MDRVNRNSKKIVLDHAHASSVSKAIWPLNTRKNISLVSHKLIQSRRHPAGLAPVIRIAFSLCVAGLALVSGIFYSWTIQLILALICAIITLILIHLLFDTDACRSKLRGSSYPTTSDKRQLRGQNLHRLGISRNLPSSSTSDAYIHTLSAAPVSVRLGTNLNPTSPGPSKDTQLIPQHQLGNTIPFPTTPMPLTPVIRVLETIDLSSTDVKHFLEIHNQQHHTDELLSERGLSEQEQSPPKPQEE